MKTYVFKESSFAEQLRKAGFCCILQQINGEDYFSVKEDQRFCDYLQSIKEQFGYLPQMYAAGSVCL